MDTQPGHIPDKKYFRIGEVSKIVGVDPHVLRYWETEFPIIRPFRGRSRQRLYRRQDVRNLLRIRLLLHDQGYTISGARRIMREPTRRRRICEESSASDQHDNKLAQIKRELRLILEHCRSKATGDSQEKC